jgi:hypothetical protein
MNITESNINNFRKMKGTEKRQEEKNLGSKDERKKKHNPIKELKKDKIG